MQVIAISLFIIDWSIEHQEHTDLRQSIELYLAHNVHIICIIFPMEIVINMNQNFCMII